jgi:hypothetical protein
MNARPTRITTRLAWCSVWLRNDAGSAPEFRKRTGRGVPERHAASRCAAGRAVVRSDPGRVDVDALRQAMRRTPFQTRLAHHEPGAARGQGWRCGIRRVDRTDQDGLFEHDPCARNGKPIRARPAKSPAKGNPMRVLKAFSLTLVLALPGAAPALAQQSSRAGDGRTLSSAATDAAVAGHASAVDQQRARLADLLSRTEVRDIAREHGIGMGRVESAAAGLSDDQMNAVAPLVAKAAAAADGLGTVTISVAAIIIILLLLILVT